MGPRKSEGRANGLVGHSSFADTILNLSFLAGVGPSPPLFSGRSPG
jgi:hypothetical protein